MDKESLVGSRVRITLGINESSQRTKNRIRENGTAGFMVTKITNSHPSLENRSAVLLQSVSMTRDGSAWFGWLPFDEIEITPWEVE